MGIQNTWNFYIFRLIMNMYLKEVIPPAHAHSYYSIFLSMYLILHLIFLLILGMILDLALKIFFLHSLALVAPSRNNKQKTSSCSNSNS